VKLIVFLDAEMLFGARAAAYNRRRQKQQTKQDRNLGN